MTFLAKVTVFCFAASYGVAFALEIWRLFRPRLILRVVGICFMAAGLLAHFIYLIVQQLPLASPIGSLLFLALILAVFSAYGTLHHPKLASGLFGLPLVLGLILLAVINPAPPPHWAGERFWGMVHGILVLLAAVGVCVGFLASAMYFVQLYRLQSKASPGGGMKLMSLERLERMNRRAILSAFPLLTVGLLVSLGMRQVNLIDNWTDPKILSSIGLWLVFAILLYLRYGAHVRGRQVALFTMVAFVVMLIALVTAHPFAAGGTP